jgi:hypothetical protein
VKWYDAEGTNYTLPLNAGYINSPIQFNFKFNVNFNLVLILTLSTVGALYNQVGLKM